MSKNRNLTEVVENEGVLTIPSGSTAQRPSSPTVGTLRYNTTTGLIEQYNSIGWQAIDAPPAVTSISGIINENTNSTITITGTNFKSGSIVSIEGAAVSNTSRPLTTTFVNSTTLTAATNAASVNYVGGASFDVKVTNPSGLTSTLTPAGNIDRDPTWNTAAGSLGTINDDGGSYSPITTLSASDADGNAITYSVVSGSLPGNVSLNSSTGALSGDPDNVTSSTTYSFTARATANSQTTDRAFSITVLPTIATAGIAAYIDANNSSSYSGSGTSWNDISGNGNNFTMSNITFNSTGIKYMEFNGTNSQVLGNSRTFSTTTVTYDGWCWVASDNPGAGNIYGFGVPPDNPSNTGFTTHFDSSGNGHFYALVGTGSSFTSTESRAFVPSRGAWHHFAFVINSASLLVSPYVNGVLGTTAAMSGAMNNLSNFVPVLGRDSRYTQGSGDRHFKGRMAQVRIYSRALSATEILRNYNATRSTFGV